MRDLKPHELVAQQFMAHKGYPHLRPSDIEKLDGQPCWYFLYDLPEGTLELEVCWNPKKREWDTTVTAFNLAG